MSDDGVIRFSPINPDDKSRVRVAEIPLSWLSGCPDHPGEIALRLEMEWDGVRDGKKAVFAYHVDVCGGCGRGLTK